MIKWGIIGPGAISEKFAEAIEGTDGSKITAVCSRSMERARSFAETNDVEETFDNVLTFAKEADVDVVYIATPHPFHVDSAVPCLNAGKAVLCEKPIAINADQARTMVEAARANNVFLMEAMWTRFVPAVRQVMAWIEAGEIGEITAFNGLLGFGGGSNKEGRLLNPALGGGALLDIGIYPVSFAHHILGSVTEATGTPHWGETGVDVDYELSLTHANGMKSTISTFDTAEHPNKYTITGSQGVISFGDPLGPTAVTLHVDGYAAQIVELPHRIKGFEYEIEAVCACLEAGEKEQPLMPLDESVAIMEVLDGIRRQWNYSYPCE